MRRLPTGEAGGTEIQAVDVTGLLRDWHYAVVGVLLLCSLNACRGVPPIQEQERLVRANNLVLEQISTRAVVNVWGKPPHHHSEFTQFFVMPDRQMIPRSRVAAGEAPKGWEASVYAGEGVFFLYPERGWLLVFHDEYLVYREELKPDQMDALIKAWAYEERFRTRLDGSPAP